METIQSLVGRIEVAAGNASNWYEIGAEIQKTAGAESGDSVAAVVSAFQYDLVEPTDEERRNRWGVYAPIIELADGRSYPMPLHVVSDRWLVIWTAIVDQLHHPAGRSRLHDLLWERKWESEPRPDRHARGAIDAFEKLASSGWSALDRAQCLVRALELARAVRDEGRRNRLVRRTVEAAQTSIRSADRQPGVALRLVESLMRLPASDQPKELDWLLEEASAAYAPDPWILQTITDLQASRSRANKGDVRPIYARQVERWRDAASRDTGLVRMHHLERALELARVHGLREQAEALRREIQALTPDEMDLKTISVTVKVPGEELERFHDAFLAGADWKECLVFFGSYGPPSGDYQRNLQTIEELQRHHPLQFLFSRVIIGPENVPILHATTEQEHKEIELSDLEARGIALWAISAAELLDRIRREKQPSPELSEVAAFFCTDIITADVAERIARALFLYWENQPDEAAHVLVPRLEAVIREVCRQAGLAIIREPRGREPGRVRPLGDLIDALKGHLDESWRRYLANLLVNPIGTNLRNRISHALLPRAYCPR